MHIMYEAITRGEKQKRYKQTNKRTEDEWGLFADDVGA